jgi:outer membrane murein-binding lipoprotein Lpp
MHDITLGRTLSAPSPRYSGERVGVRGRSSLKLCLALLLLGSASCGCASRQQLSQILTEKQQLVAQIDAEKKQNASLAARLQLADSRAAEAERELALLDGGKTPRSSASLVTTPARTSSPSTSLEQWARSQPLLKYDSRQRAARADLDLAFDNTDHLTFDGRRALNKVADLLADAGAARYGVRVSGIETKAGDARAATRAQEVAGYLQKRGLAESRVSTTTSPGTSLVDEEGRKLGTGGRLLELQIVELPGRGDAVANEGEGWKSSSKR